MELHSRADRVVTDPAMQLGGIRKRFGRVVAIDGADLVVRKGSVHALLGENGAGKTTLMRIAFGLTPPDEGVIHIDGARVRLKSPADAIRAGVGMVQQHFALVPAMTVRENIALGMSPAHALDITALGIPGRHGTTLNLQVPVAELPVPEQQRVELLKTRARGARLVILDEPTAALAPHEAGELFAWLRAFRNRGGSVVLITHKLREALTVADDISVLRHGRVAWSGPRDAADIDVLIAAMLGESRSLAMSQGGRRERRAEVPAEENQTVVRADGLQIRDGQGVTRVSNATLRMTSGEIVGVAGVEGSGARELLYALAGRLRPSGGSLQLPDAIGFIPEDRQHDALMMDESVAANVALRDAGRRRGWFTRRNVRTAAQRVVRDGAVLAPDISAPVSSLSGGNQQRLVVARELDGHPSLLVAVNPTRGLDVVAAAAIHRHLRDAAERGMAVAYHTADLDELIDVADRVLVTFEGRLLQVDRDREAVGRAMLGAA